MRNRWTAERFSYRRLFKIRYKCYLVIFLSFLQAWSISVIVSSADSSAIPKPTSEHKAATATFRAFLRDTACPSFSKAILHELTEQTCNTMPVKVEKVLLSFSCDGGPYWRLFKRKLPPQGRAVTLYWWYRWWWYSLSPMFLLCVSVQRANGGPEDNLTDTEKD